MSPNDRHLQEFKLLYNILPCCPKSVCATNSIQQNWQYVTSKIMLKRLWLLFCVFSRIHVLSILGHLLWRKQATMLWTSPWRGPHGEGLKPLANGQKGAGPANNHVSEFGSRFSNPSQDLNWLQPWPTAWFQPHGRPWARNSAKLLQDPSLSETVQYNQCLLF